VQNKNFISLQFLAYGKMQLFYFSARKQQTEEEGEHGNVYIDRDVATGHRA